MIFLYFDEKFIEICSQVSKWQYICNISGQKSHNAPNKNPPMHHFVTKMCTHVHISLTKWCILGCRTGAFWDLWDWSKFGAKWATSHYLRQKWPCSLLHIPSGIILLTHLPSNKMAAISQTTLSNAFLWMKSFLFWFQFHWSLFPWV